MGKTFRWCELPKHNIRCLGMLFEWVRKKDNGRKATDWASASLLGLYSQPHIIELNNKISEQNKK